MRDHPDTALLLVSARRALLEQVAPALEGEAHSTALMLARVFSLLVARLATDARALAAAESGIEAEELVRLAQLLGEPPQAARMAAGSANQAVMRLSRELVKQIRSGAFDPPGSRHDALLDFLFAVTRAKVAESNPKALDHIGRAGEEGA